MFHSLTLYQRILFSSQGNGEKYEKNKDGEGVGEKKKCKEEKKKNTISQEKLSLFL